MLSKGFTDVLGHQISEAPCDREESGEHMSDSNLDNPVIMGWLQYKGLALPILQDSNKDISVPTQLQPSPGKLTGAEAWDFLS